ncbi:major facilitator superfamily domain-containing protein [Aspergillus welwitschiae]|uniref:Major facilitator superfamily domain-containing protein n=1 Tax=Aspergillus welwitschiae TaxID=1341132 RepID=A0A3F3PXS5_9EURO|nr:major facilitator superfamily domain-containing protein [Aspergillus welwitschiae]RDH31668.1 major facilitator superfamily domain-containing protein [Aspergillus welwitschiae]
MVSPRTLFTASRVQTWTYLLGVCPFSIAFLVFINSSISFVVTELIGLRNGEGDAVGTLGFADELLALVACPLWGVLSDRIGVRHVCTTGYAIVALALVLFVQAKNVYPQLLLGRLLFSLGGAAVSTMVTAVLPAVAGSHSSSQHKSTSDSRTSTSSSSRLAGFVGMCAGCGALVALVVFLPLPARFQQWGLSPAEAIQRSYYLVAAVSLVISILCFFGLRNLPGEEGKSWSVLWSARRRGTPDSGEACSYARKFQLPYLEQLGIAFALGFRNSDIFLGYLGGFVARASSVGISLFIPLAVNHYYRMSGLCGSQDGEAENPGDLKKSCHKAYVLASILTGVSQLVALLAAPAFGYLSERSRRRHVPLLAACFAGFVGYTTFALLPSPEFNGEYGSPGVFVVMGLVGISQIGAIVCSLSVLSSGILSLSEVGRMDDQLWSTPSEPSEDEGEDEDENENNNENNPVDDEEEEHGEDRPLMSHRPGRKERHLSHLKGSIAGVYSLYGGAGILLLTKLGGLLFDVLSSGAPFYIMAGFNGALLLAGLVSGFIGHSRSAGPAGFGV